MQAASHLPFLRETVLFLALAGVLIPLLQRWRVNQILAFLALGASLGPFGLGLFVASAPWLGNFTFYRHEAVQWLADLGVLFLMFTIGLELSAERLWALRRWVLGAGPLQVGVTAAVICSLAYLFGNRLEVAIVLGLVLSLSSTAVVMQLLADRRELGSRMGQASFAILMFQDLAVVPILILIDVLAGGLRSNIAVVVGGAIAKSLLTIALIWLIGRRLIRPLFRHLVKPHQPEVFVALTLLSTLGIAGVTAAAGLSMALGALLAGLLLAETEFKHEIEITIEPFRGLLMGLFFMSVGMGIDVREVAREPLWLPLSVAGLFLIKAAVIALLFRAGRIGWGQAVEGALLLGQGGEFALIIVGYAMSAGLIAPAVGQFLLLVVSLSLLATPPVAKLGRMLGTVLDGARSGKRQDLGLPEQAGALQARVVIAGFGRVGQMLGRLLQSEHVPFVAFENDAGRTEDMRAKGYPVFFGNAARAELLRKAGAENAAAIVLTMDHPASALHAVKGIRRDLPDVPLFVRCRDEAHAHVLKAAGATVIVPETLESSLRLSAHVLAALGIPPHAVARLIDAERDSRLADAGSENAGNASG